MLMLDFFSFFHYQRILRPPMIVCVPVYKKVDIIVVSNPSSLISIILLRYF